MDVLAGIFAAAALQDLSYTSKTALVSRGHRRLAVVADVFAVLTSSVYLILTASVTMRSGLSFATIEAFAAIAIGGACGTVAGMFVVEWLVDKPQNASDLFNWTKTLYRFTRTASVRLQPVATRTPPRLPG